MAASGRTRKVAAGVALLIALAMGATALIGPRVAAPSSKEQYCTGLQTYVGQLTSFQDPTDTAQLDRLITDGTSLSKSAPDALRDQWGVLVRYLEQVRAAGGDRAKLQEANATSDPTAALQAIAADSQQNCAGSGSGGTA
jgi:hypothetical protein